MGARRGTVFGPPGSVPNALAIIRCRIEGSDELEI
jgi:hypothetical protein